MPALAGVGQYTLYVDLPRTGGLYETSNVTYRGTTIGRVTAVEPTEAGARATLSIGNGVKIPADAAANVHSVSAVGEQYIDLVPKGNPGRYLSDGQTITDSSVPSEIGPAVDSANRVLSALPQDKLESLLNETSDALGGLGPNLHRLVDSTNNVVRGFKDNIGPIDDIVDNVGPIFDSQRDSGTRSSAGRRTSTICTGQMAEQDQALRTGLQQAAPARGPVTRSSRRP